MSVTKSLGMPTGPAQVFTGPPEFLSSISRSRTQLASHAQDRARNRNATFQKSRHPRAAPVYQPHSLRTTRRSPLSNPPTPVRPPRGRCSRLAASSSGRAALSMLASCSPCRDVHRVCIYCMPVYVCRSAYVHRMSYLLMVARCIDSWGTASLNVSCESPCVCNGRSIRRHGLVAFGAIVADF